MILSHYTVYNFLLLLLLYFFVTVNSELSNRLPNNTIPRLYKIEFNPNLFSEKFSFTGRSSIYFEVIQHTNSLILHKSKNLFIDNEYTEISNEVGKIYKVVHQSWNSKRELITIKCSDALEIGNYTLKLQWNGYGNDINFSGMYRAVDQDDKNNSK